VIYVDVSTKKQMTVKDVSDAAEGFGKGIRQRWSWQKGDVMAVFSPNTIDFAPVVFGTHWAGGVACLFNNMYTVGELVSQLKSSGAKALVTHVACVEVAQEAALIVGLPLGRIILAGPNDPSQRFKHFTDIHSSARDVQRLKLDPKNDLAYLVYSSGTTGLPKGVMLTHENVVANILQVHANEGQVSHWSRDRIIGFLPLYHIYGMSR
jgi:4-coumarate--CoA ligase